MRSRALAFSGQRAGEVRCALWKYAQCAAKISTEIGFHAPGVRQAQYAQPQGVWCGTLAKKRPIFPWKTEETRRRTREEKGNPVLLGPAALVQTDAGGQKRYLRCAAPVRHVMRDSQCQGQVPRRKWRSILLDGAGPEAAQRNREKWARHNCRGIERGLSLQPLCACGQWERAVWGGRRQACRWGRSDWPGG